MWRAALVLMTACGRFGFGDTATDGPTTNGDAVHGDAVEDVYARTVIDDGALAYFRFDEVSGPTLRSAVGTATGTYEGDFTFGVPGAVGGNPTVLFDGSTTRIDLGDAFRFAGSAALSLEVWMRPDTIVDTRFIVARGSSDGDGYVLYYGDSYLLFARVTMGIEGGYAATGAPAVDAWTHVVATHDGTESALYVNGVEVVRNVGAAAAIADEAGTFVIGDDSPAQFNKVSGALDELAIYGTALSPARVLAHYDIGRL